MPIVITIITITIRFLPDKKYFWPSNEMVFTLTFIYALVFEIILPALSKTYTADYFDILAYGGGLLLYFTTISHGENTKSNLQPKKTIS
jgi:FtsH-binding integral membrane protein